MSESGSDDSSDESDSGDDSSSGSESEEDAETDEEKVGSISNVHELQTRAIPMPWRWYLGRWCISPCLRQQ